MSTNNIYYVDMEQRFNDFNDGKIDMSKIHEMVYDIDNVSLGLRQLSKSSGRMSKGHDGTNYQTLEKYSIYELSKIVKDRLLNRKMNYVRRTYIPKDRKETKMRPLGICSAWDKLVEKCIQLVLDPYCETKFVDSSFGFREQVSAHNALARVKNQCQTMPFVLSLDLQDYFGTIDPDVTYREMWHIGIKNQVILNYIYQFIKKGYYEDSCKVESPKGAPQGSILGPLVANLYLHRFAEKFKFSITKYLTRNMKLIINDDKTRIYDLTTERMKFLGYVFYAWGYNQKKGKHRVSNKLPKEKADEIVEKCRELLNKIKKKPCFENIHNWNTYVVGLHNYYKGMTHFYECFTCIGWRVRKLFYHTMSKNTKFIKEQSYKNNFMEGVYRSWGINGYYSFKCYPIIEIWWANWDIKLICGKRSRVQRENPYDYGEKKHKPGVSLEAISYLVNSSKHIKSSKLAMFRVSKYSSVKGISYMSGEFVPATEYHCHHIIPKCKKGTHDFDNLCVLSEVEHTILHSPTPERLYELYPKRKARIKMLINNL